MQPDPRVHAFSFGGVRFRVGIIVSVILEGGMTVQEVIVRDASVAASASGIDASSGVHSGDSALLCGNADGTEAGKVISRQWLPPDQDAVVWQPADGGSPTPAVAIQVVSGPAAVEEEAPPLAYPALSPESRQVRAVAAEGVATLTICASLYADDFATRLHRKQSVHGVKMVFPGWLAAAHVSRHAVRDIAVTPPGVNSDVVLEATSSDLTEGEP